MDWNSNRTYLAWIPKASRNDPITSITWNVKRSPVWHDDPLSYFSFAKLKFSFKKITSDTGKFHHVACYFNAKLVSLSSDIILNHRRINTEEWKNAYLMRYLIFNLPCTVHSTKFNHHALWALRIQGDDFVTLSKSFKAIFTHACEDFVSSAFDIMFLQKESNGKPGTSGYLLEQIQRHSK